MKKLILTLLFIPLIGFAAIKDWDYLPYISYSDKYPCEIIKEGRILTSSLTFGKSRSPCKS